MSTFLFQGLSGQRYIYGLMAWHDLALLTRQRGIYLFAKGSAEAPIPVFIKEANNIRAAVSDAVVPRDTAQSVHGADLLFIHVEQDPERRHQEKQDLVAAYQPVMNVPTAHGE